MTVAKPSVLVLLATYNGEAYLAEQINSILSQEEVDVTILASDDLSQDGTRACLVKFANQYSNVELLEVSNGSGSAGANFRRLIRSVVKTDYEFVAFADQDDIWHSSKLINAIQSLDRTGAQGYSCAVDAFWPTGKRKIIAQSSEVRAADYMLEGAGQGCTFVLTWDLFCVVRKFCQDTAPLAEKLHYHDWLVYLIARRLGVRWFFDPVPWISYRQHNGNEIGSRGGILAVFRRLSLIKNGWYGRQIAAAAEIARHFASNDATPTVFSDLLHSSPGWKRRLKLTGFLYWYGRRRLSDRIVLAFSAILGWV
jgi:rhamnosyltransferase